MASPLVSSPVYQCQGYQVPNALGQNVEFLTLCNAYEGRSKAAYDQGIQESPFYNDNRNTFLCLVRKRSLNVSQIFSTLHTAIRTFQTSNSIASRDYDLIRKLVDFVYGYNLICDTQWPLLRDEIHLRQRDLKGQEAQALAQRLQRERVASRARIVEEALERAREEEALFDRECIEATIAAERRANPSPSEASGSGTSASAQSLYIIAGRDPTARSSRRSSPAITPPPRHTQKIKVSAEELALILAIKLSLDQKTLINWPAHRGSREHDRLDPEAILDLGETVVDGVLPGAVVVPASELPAEFTYISFRQFHDRSIANPVATWRRADQ